MAFRAHLPTSQAPLRRPDDAAVDVMRFADPPLGGRNSEFDAAPPPKRIMVPAPPPKPRGGAVRPSRALQPGGRGHVNRSALKEAVKSHGQGQPGTQRWSTMKALFTELMHATSGNSPTKLLTTLAEAKALGGDQWPEFAKAQERMAALQNLRSDLLKASSGIDIKEIGALLSKADDMGVRYKPDFTVRPRPGANPKADAEGEFGPYIEAAERRLERLKALQQELDEASHRGADLGKISNSLRVAAELGVQSWPQAEGAHFRLRLLQSLLNKLTSCFGLAKDADADGEDDPQLQVALQAALAEAEQVLGDLSELPPPPLGPALEAAQQRLALLRLEGVAGVRARLRHELSRAAEQGDILAMRGALAEADQMSRANVTGLQTAWAAPERARRRLAEFVGLEAELQLLSSRERVLPPPPGAIEAALARADALNCGAWPLRVAAAERLEELRSLEAGLLRAVEAGSEVELLEATQNAEEAGLTAWPLLNSAQSLLSGFRSAAAAYVSPNAAWQDFGSSWAAQRLLVELSGVRPIGRRTSSSSMGWTQVVHAGLALELIADVGENDGREDMPIDIDLLAKGICKASGGRSAENLCLSTIRSDLLVAGFRMTSAAPTGEAGTSCAQDSLVLLEKELRQSDEFRSQSAEEDFAQSAGREAKQSSSHSIDLGPKVKAAWLLYSLITEQQDQEKQLEELRRLQQRLRHKLEERLRQFEARSLRAEDEQVSVQQVGLLGNSPERDGSEVADELFATACKDLIEDIVRHELNMLKSSPATPDVVDLLFENRAELADAEVVHVLSKTFQQKSEEPINQSGSIEELAHATLQDSRGGVGHASQVQCALAQERPKSYSPISYLTGSGASGAAEEIAFAAVGGIFGTVQPNALVDDASTQWQQNVSSAAVRRAREEMAFTTAGPPPQQQKEFSSVSGMTGSGAEEELAFATVGGVLGVVHRDAALSSPLPSQQGRLSVVSAMTKSAVEDELAFATVSNAIGDMSQDSVVGAVAQDDVVQPTWTATQHRSLSSGSPITGSNVEELAFATVQGVLGPAAHDAAKPTSLPRPQESFSAVSCVTGSGAEELAFSTIHGVLGVAGAQDSATADRVPMDTHSAVSGCSHSVADGWRANARAGGMPASTVSGDTGSCAENSVVRSTVGNILQLAGPAREADDRSSPSAGLVGSAAEDAVVSAAVEAVMQREASPVESDNINHIVIEDALAVHVSSFHSMRSIGDKQQDSGTDHVHSRQQHAAPSDGIPGSLENSIVQAAVGNIVGDAVDDFHASVALPARDSLTSTHGVESAGAAEDAIVSAAVDAALQSVETPLGSETTNQLVNEDASAVPVSSFPSVSVYDPSPSSIQQDSVVSAIMAGVFNYSEVAPSLSDQIAVPPTASMQRDPRAIAEAVVCDLLWDTVREHAGVDDVHRQSIEASWVEVNGRPSLLTPNLEPAV